MSMNRAAYMTDVKKIELRDCAIPELSPEDVLLEISYVGVCGSDLHFFESGERKGQAFALPFLLGHEASAVVSAVGKGVKSLSPGDRVVIEPQKTCGLCEFCRSGHYNMCPDVIFPSVPPYDGMLRRYMAFPEHLCYRLPDTVSLLEGTLAEPLAVGLSAADCGGVTVGQTVVILGVGPIGLTTLLACKARGVSRIIVVDLFQNRLENALSLGADYALNAREVNAPEEVMRLTDNLGADVVFETAGNRKTTAQAVDYLKRCGTIVLVGNVNGETPMRFMDLMYKQGQLKTIYRYTSHFKTAISVLAAGHIDADKMISRVFPFEQAQDAFDCALRDKMNVVKVVIEVGGACGRPWAAPESTGRACILTGKEGAGQCGKHTAAESLALKRPERS